MKLRWNLIQKQPPTDNNHAEAVMFILLFRPFANDVDTFFLPA